MLASAGKKEHLFKEHLQVVASYGKTPVLDSEYCGTFKNTYFEEHLRTGSSEKMCS